MSAAGNGGQDGRASGVIVRVLRAIGERKAALQDGGALVLNSAKGEVCADAGAVRRMVSEGLLARVRGTVCRTDAGRAFLRRALATWSDNPASEQQRVTAERTVTTGGQTLRVIENVAESPLAWLATRKDRGGKPMLSPIQREAGERLFRDHERGHQRPSVTASWDPTGVRGSRRADGLSVAESVHDARRRVEGALTAVGPGLAQTLIAVCCEGMGLEALERRFGWPARSGKVVLRLALDHLASHYGMASATRGSESADVVHWGADDYRPSA